MSFNDPRERAYSALTPDDLLVRRSPAQLAPLTAASWRARVLAPQGLRSRAHVTPLPHPRPSTLVLPPQAIEDMRAMASYHRMDPTDGTSNGLTAAIDGFSRTHARATPCTPPARPTSPAVARASQAVESLCAANAAPAAAITSPAPAHSRCPMALGSHCRSAVGQRDGVGRVRTGAIAARSRLACPRGHPAPRMRALATAMPCEPGREQRACGDEAGGSGASGALTICTCAPPASPADRRRQWRPSLPWRRREAPTPADGKAT